MSIYLNNESKVIVQGITGREGLYHANRMRAYGTNMVGGVTPGKGGQTVEGFVVFDGVAEARAKTGANVSVIFVPPPFAADAILEAADAGSPRRRSPKARVRWGSLSSSPTASTIRRPGR